MMIQSLILLLAIAILAGLIVWVRISSQRQMSALLDRDRNNPAFSLLNQTVESLRKQVSESLESTSKRLNDQIASNATQMIKAQEQTGARLDNAAKTVLDVQKKLTKLEQDNLKIYEVGKDIASLQEILRAPKLRGNLGELFLGDLLSQILPPQHFILQYAFRDGQAVDAVIKLGLGLVPIDSKFPLESFQRMMETADPDVQRQNQKQFASEVRKHAKSIAEKYIRPDEGTFPFAFMYIPAENVYYETIIKDARWGEEKSIASTVMEMRVIPVSPNTFFAYLQSVVMGLKGMRIEERAREIFDILKSLGGEVAKFREDFDLVGRHLRNSVGKFEEADRHLDRFETKLLSVEGTEKKPLTE